MSKPRIRVVLARPSLPDPLIALRAVADARHPFLRHAAGPGSRGTAWSYLALEPEEVLVTARIAGGAPLTRRLAALRAERPIQHGPRVPFAGGWAGLVGYEARAAVER
ncbi:MAG: hypothetical protein O2894_11780, partial [Planctomycetota bacterium]|nr:hypothetical protein [Planctomycetota bacterium]